jgi:branched-chain amino acid transport system ATP-binding protein
MLGNSMAELCASGVVVRFGGVVAVSDAALRAEAGKILGIIGPNGSGKTTLLNALSGDVRVAQGHVTIGGRDVTNVRAAGRARLGIRRTFQNLRLVASLTVRENVMLGLAGNARWGNSKERQLAQMADSALDRLGLLDQADANPSALPYGSLRRTEIARAIVSNPDVLLLDEPTAGMTNSERKELAAVVKALAGDGKVVVLVEHDLPMMVELSDSLMAMDFGRVVAAGPPTKVVESEAVQVAYLGKGGIVHEDT